MVLAQNQTQISETEKSPGVSPHLHGQLIYNRESKNTQWRKTGSLTNCIGKTGYSHAKA